MVDETKLDMGAMAKKPEASAPIAGAPAAGKGKRWIVKLILVLIVGVVIYYLFKNPDVILEPVNKFFNNMLK